MASDSDDKDSPKEQLKRRAAAFSVSSSMFSMHRVAWFVLALTAGITLAYPMLSGNRMTWSAGAVTSHHRINEADCTSCHSGGAAFEVTDGACESCHKMSVHGERPMMAGAGQITAEHNAAGVHHQIAAQNATSLQCVSCHQEHNGDRALNPKDSTLCVSCHANLQSIINDADFKPIVEKIPSWDAHPEFAILRAGEKVSDTGLQLNHALHLKANLRGPKGAITLQCTDCHLPSDDRKSIKPIDRKVSCSGCHSLEFDTRLPGVEVPHGNPDEVFRFLLNTYVAASVKDSSLTENIDTKDARPLERTKPGGSQDKPRDQARQGLYRAAFDRARAAERELFTRTGCKLCHNPVPSTASPELLSPNSLIPTSAFTVGNPEERRNLMTRAAFNHGTHDNLACATCHKGVDKSESSDDLLMPSVADCRTCHVSGNETGKVQSECVLCHSFHQALALPVGKKRNLSKNSELFNTVVKLRDGKTK